MSGIQGDGRESIELKTEFQQVSPSRKGWHASLSFNHVRSAFCSRGLDTKGMSRMHWQSRYLRTCTEWAGSGRGTGNEVAGWRKEISRRCVQFRHGYHGVFVRTGHTMSSGKNTVPVLDKFVPTKRRTKMVRFLFNPPFSLHPYTILPLSPSSHLMYPHKKYLLVYIFPGGSPR